MPTLSANHALARAISNSLGNPTWNALTPETRLYYTDNAVKLANKLRKLGFVVVAQPKRATKRAR